MEKKEEEEEEEEEDQMREGKTNKKLFKDDGLIGRSLGENKRVLLQIRLAWWP